MNKGMQLISAGFSSSIHSNTIIFAFIFEIVIFHTEPRWVTVLGAICIILGIIMVIVEKIKNGEKYKVQSKNVFVI